jgi:uncharacterized protein (DUF2344 family)
MLLLENTHESGVKYKIKKKSQALDSSIQENLHLVYINLRQTCNYCNKNVDIIFSAHDTFLEKPSSGMPKAKIF